MLLYCVSVQGMDPFFKGYRNTAQFNKALTILTHEYLKVKSLTTTLGGNEVLLITLNKGEVKPALLIVGDTEGDNPVGSEIVYHWLQKLIAKENNITLSELLDKNTIYAIPRPAPDALSNFFAAVQQRSSVNTKRVDDDKDLQKDEDPAEDLNEDGVISIMRVEDDQAMLTPHPQLPQLMVKALYNEKKYKVFSEGIDNDKDELFNEDGVGGVDFNRNFTFRYPYFENSAGPHQISERETRALADFAFAHPEIYMVLSFGKEDNLQHLWKENPKETGKRIKTAVLKEDASLYHEVSKDYVEAFGEEKSRVQGSAAGAFSHWAYFHFGRLSLSLRPWSIPLMDEKEVKDKRQSDLLREWLWLQKNRPEALLPWREITHIDFPNEKVEIGGLKPYYDTVPPYAVCEKKGAAFSQFIEALIKKQVDIQIENAQLKSSGNGAYRLTFTVKNNGSLPSALQMGRLSRQVHPLNIHV